MVIAGRVIRGAAAGAVLVVAVIAAVVSFVHIEHLAVTHGQAPLAARLLQLSIDGTVAAASMVMLRAARAGLGTPWLARLMLALAVAATLLANVGYGLPFGWTGALISGWPACAFIGCAEIAIGMVRQAKAAALAANMARPRPAPPANPAPAITAVPTSPLEAARWVMRPASVAATWVVVIAATSPPGGRPDPPHPSLGGLAHLVVVCGVLGLPLLGSYLRVRRYRQRSSGLQMTVDSGLGQTPRAMEAYAKPSLRKYSPIAARNDDLKVLSGRR